MGEKGEVSLQQFLEKVIIGFSDKGIAFLPAE